MHGLINNVLYMSGLGLDVDMDVGRMFGNGSFAGPGLLCLGPPESLEMTLDDIKIIAMFTILSQYPSGEKITASVVSVVNFFSI